MTSVLQRPDPLDLVTPERRRGLLAVAVVAGLALGAVDLLLQATLPYPWANLANSSAVWALAAFGYGVWFRRPGVRVAAGGAVLLVVAVAAYYVAAAIALGDDLANVWAPTSIVWALFGILAGVVFAPLGAAVRAPGWPGVVAAAGAGAVCFAEFAVVLTRVDDVTAAERTDVIQTAVLTAVIGLVALLAAARTVPVIGRALLVSVPLAAAGFAGFAAAGFTPGLG